MTTAILQTFRKDQSEWMSKCLASVKSWALNNNFEYIFLGDEFFDFVPEKFRKKALYPRTDIARLYFIEEMLKKYDKVVWIDADILIFDPDNFDITTPYGYAFSHEVMTYDEYCTPYSINNSIIAVEKGNKIFEQYKYFCEEILDSASIERVIIGPALLCKLNEIIPLERFTFNGILCTALEGILRNDLKLIQKFNLAHEFKIASANLCHNERDTTKDINAYDKKMDTLVDILLSTKGSMFYGRPERLIRSTGNLKTFDSKANIQLNVKLFNHNMKFFYDSIMVPLEHNQVFIKQNLFDFEYEKKAPGLYKFKVNDKQLFLKNHPHEDIFSPILFDDFSNKNSYLNFYLMNKDCQILKLVHYGNGSRYKMIPFNERDDSCVWSFEKIKIIDNKNLWVIYSKVCKRGLDYQNEGPLIHNWDIHKRSNQLWYLKEKGECKQIISYVGNKKFGLDRNNEINIAHSEACSIWYFILN